MHSKNGGCLDILLEIFVDPLVHIVFQSIDKTLTKAKDTWGDRGCLVLLVSFALLAFILPIVTLGLDWECWLMLAGFLALFVIAVGSSYRLGAGARSRSNNTWTSDRGKATSGPELITRYQAGERDFREARLRWTVLLHTDLSGVDLSGADLRGAELDSATLQDAILLDANLRGADLQRANLSGANLRKADLSGANLREADLRGANVTEEQLAQAASLEGATVPDGTEHTSKPEPAPAEPEPQDAQAQPDQPSGLNADGETDA
jgi:hypothetical protein